MSFFDMRPEADADFVLGQIRKNLSEHTCAGTAVDLEAIGDHEGVPSEPDPELARHLRDAEGNRRADLPVPGTRQRRLKLLIGRVIRPFMLRQVHFNGSLLSGVRVLADFSAEVGRGLRDAEYRRERDMAGLNRSLAEVQAQAARKAAGLEERIGALRQAEEEWRRLGAALERRMKGLEDWVRLKAEQVDRLEAFSHTARMELFYELRTLLRLVGPDEARPRIVNPDKHARQAAEGRIRLNVGAGGLVLEEYLNVDQRPLPGIDVVADVRDLPFDDASVAELRAAHVIEHFPHHEVERVLLPHWRRLLAPGGKLVIVCPDWQTMFDEYRAGRYSFEELRLVTFGAQEYEGDAHHTMFTPDSLTGLLRAAGFGEVVVKESGRRNAACYEMEVEAVP